MGAPWPGMRNDQSASATGASAVCQPVGQSVSRNGAGRVTRSPATATWVAGSRSQTSPAVTAGGSRCTSKGRAPRMRRAGGGGDLFGGGGGPGGRGGGPPGGGTLERG